jgi:hypothetical protein
MLIAQKHLKQKNSEKKSYSWRSVISIFFASGLSPYNDSFLTYFTKSTKKSENPGLMRPGLWKSCHPR